MNVDTGKIGNVSINTWMKRPHAHIGEATEGLFSVGSVDSCFIDRAKEAGIDPKDALRVQLFIESESLGSTLPFINAIVGGKTATFFETDEINSKIVKARIKLQGAHETPDGRFVPLIVIESAKIQNR